MLTSGTALVQVLVSDGFHSAAAVSVDVPRHSPQVAILWLADGSIVRTDTNLRLWGVATASDGRTLPGNALHREPVGDGSEVWAELPEWEGEHRATLQSPGAIGRLGPRLTRVVEGGYVRCGVGRGQFDIGLGLRPLSCP
jgi:hypothetical protein